MTNHSEYAPTNSKLHPETIPTVEKSPKVEQRVGVVEEVPTRRETVTTTNPTVEKTPKVEQRVGVVEEVPIRRETVTTTNSTSPSHPTKSKQEYNPSLPILGAIALAIPLAGLLGYLLHQPGERVVTRTVTQIVPVLTVPASPGVTPSAVYPAPNVASPSPVGPAIVGPARVGVDRVGEK